jgi:hypothetical protein
VTQPGGTPTYWIYGAAAVGLVALQIIVLHAFGQPWVGEGGLLLWVSDPLSPKMSQQLFDWYSITHIIHGFIFFALLHVIMPRTPLAVRFLIAMGIEVGWEILENTPAVIVHYRKQALAAGYRGDSVVNSVSDTVMAIIGFVLAARLRARYVIAIALAFEIFTACMIRDNLTLNVINLLARSDWAPIQSIHKWQEGAKR